MTELENAEKYIEILKQQRDEARRNLSETRLKMFEHAEMLDKIQEVLDGDCT